MSKTSKEQIQKTVAEMAELKFGKEKLVLLSEGADIAKALFLIHNDFEYYRFNGGISEDASETIVAALNEVSTKLAGKA